MASNELVYLCRSLRSDEAFLELVQEMTNDSLVRFTAADPTNTQEMQAARYQYDAVQDMLSLVQKYANVDLT